MWPIFCSLWKRSLVSCWFLTALLLSSLYYLLRNMSSLNAIYRYMWCVYWDILFFAFEKTAPYEPRFSASYILRQQYWTLKLPYHCCWKKSRVHRLQHYKWKGRGMRARVPTFLSKSVQHETKNVAYWFWNREIRGAQWPSPVPGSTTVEKKNAERVRAGKKRAENWVSGVSGFR